MKPEIEGDVEHSVVTDVFWQKGNGQNLPDKNPCEQLKETLYRG